MTDGNAEAMESTLFSGKLRHLGAPSAALSDRSPGRVTE
jgi:hypothetical protein